jgi:hypothetical protein
MDGDAQDVLLEKEHTVRLCEDRLKAGVEVLDRLTTVAAA